jgi:hypothetical protein
MSEFKNIPFMPWVQVSKDGDFKDQSKAGKEIKHNLTRLGKYPTVTLIPIGDVVLMVWVAHVVALTWVELPTDVALKYLVVDYKDKNPNNTHADNLEWVVGEYSNKTMKTSAGIIEAVYGHMPK